MGLTETSASAFKKMPGCLDGWPSHVLVLGLSATSTTGWADIFRWLVSLVDDSARSNGPQRGVRFLVHMFSVLAGGQWILGGALATYCLHTVLCEVGPDLPWPYLLLLCSQDVALRRLCKVIKNNSWTLYKNVPWSKVSSFKLHVKLKADEFFFTDL